jgi:uncharacterized protein (DUF2164 family)
MRNNYFIQLAILALITIGFSSCEPTEDTGYTIPSTYNFDNVSYSGQTKRLDMMAEISTYVKAATDSGTVALDAAKIKDMYGDNTGNHFLDSELNTASNQLKNKTISTQQSNFESYMDAVAVASQSSTVQASDGQAGYAEKNSGSKYLMNANGVELAQIIEKGLMGACFYYQGTAVYLGASKIDEDNTTVVDGEGTKMEHHFDESFGYFGVPTDFPTNTSGIKFWGKYCNKHETAYPLNAKMMDAFLKGRAAISAKDMTTRDEQITEIRKQWELVVAASGIYYLNNVVDGFGTDVAADLHELSEAFGFIMSLKFGAGTGSITTSNIDVILTDLFGSSNPLVANLWNVDVTKIETAKTALVGYLTDLANVKDTL